ncbi:MAG: hypothetical protein ACP5SH_25090 [Syntrophobacteraceae bacterium]
MSDHEPATTISHRRRVAAGGGAHFRVWAPRPKKVEVLLEAGPGAPATVQLEQQEDGYFAGLAPQAADSTRYRFRLEEAGCFPDPVSRYQPDGPYGASQVVVTISARTGIVDPSGFGWNDSGWQGVGLEGQVIYEMHIGTFTRDGTWRAAQRELAELVSRTISAVSSTAIGKRVRQAARGRKTIIVAENEPQLTKLVRPLQSGGYGLTTSITAPWSR